MEKKQNNNWVIKCPHCGAEVHAAEIFYPEQLIGEPKNIIRDPLNRILYVEYKEDGEPCLTEHYCCDGCERDFVVEATISFKAKPEAEEKDFSKLESSLL